MKLEIDKNFLKLWHDQIIQDRITKKADSLKHRSTKWLQEELMLEVDSAEEIDQLLVRAINLELKRRGVNENKSGLTYSTVKP